MTFLQPACAEARPFLRSSLLAFLCLRWHSRIYSEWYATRFTSIQWYSRKSLCFSLHPLSHTCTPSLLDLFNQSKSYMTLIWHELSLICIPIQKWRTRSRHDLKSDRWFIGVSSRLIEYRSGSRPFDDSIIRNLLYLVRITVTKKWPLWTCHRRIARSHTRRGIPWLLKTKSWPYLEVIQAWQ